ncbi:hypothetical protein [Reyranella sp.]|uniref:hypothetical protein n=1 Tax=Reyranella sp. TaxID=1929291 RepID=UPI003D117237
MKTTATAIMAAIALALGLAGCAGTTDERQAIADKITISYAALKSAVVLYSALPPCGDANATSLCSDPAIVAQVKKALVVADTAVVEAKAQILASTDQSSVEKWSSYATSAVALLAQTLATYGIK